MSATWVIAADAPLLVSRHTIEIAVTGFEPAQRLGCGLHKVLVQDLLEQAPN